MAGVLPIGNFNDNSIQFSLIYNDAMAVEFVQCVNLDPLGRRAWGTVTAVDADNNLSEWAVYGDWWEPGTHVIAVNGNIQLRPHPTKPNILLGYAADLRSPAEPDALA